MPAGSGSMSLGQKRLLIASIVKRRGSAVGGPLIDIMVFIIILDLVYSLCGNEL